MMLEDRKFVIFGEIMCAVHSIEYDALDSVFYLFSIYDIETKLWQPWEKVIEFGDRYGLSMVPVLFDGHFQSLQEIKTWMDDRAKNPSTIGIDVCPEGFVLRIVDSFNNENFSKSIAKYVRKGHVQTDKTWKRTWKKATMYPGKRIPHQVEFRSSKEKKIEEKKEEEKKK